MGIKELAKLIEEEAPEAVSTDNAENYRGKVLSIDASIFIHQFDSAVPKFTNRHREKINVLQGFFQRTAFLLRKGIRPVYVFDGTPPESKRLKVTKDGKVQSKRRVTPAHSPGSEKFGDLKTLLSYLGVPFIQAPSEAEATCADLVRRKVAWGAVTEDMDALPFGCPRLIRNLKAKKNLEVKEYNLDKILDQLKLSKDQFVDLCILLGCDYTKKIKGLGRKKALKMIQTHKTIENIIQVIDAKDRIPPDFDHITARRQFLSPVVTTDNVEDMKWTQPDEKKVLHFLSQEKHMKVGRVRSVLGKLCSPQIQKPQKRKRSKMTESPPSNQKKIKNFFPVKKSARQDKSTPGALGTSSID